MQARTWIRFSALSLAIAMASGGFAQTTSPPPAADQNHSAHHPPTASETPAAALMDVPDLVIPAWGSRRAPVAERSEDLARKAWAPAALSPFGDASMLPAQAKQVAPVPDQHVR